MNIKSYSELMQIETFIERFYYLNLIGKVGDETFGSKRYINQILYKSDDWKSFRRGIIIRDNGCDLGISGREIGIRITVHHINPVTIEDVINRNPKVFDPENVITTSDITHKAIHYGTKDLLTEDLVTRIAHDTCPWRH